MNRHFVYWQHQTLPGVLYFRCGNTTGSEPLNGRDPDAAARAVARTYQASTLENLNLLSRSQLQEVQNACNPVAVSGYLNGVAKQLCQREDSNQIARCPEFRAVLLKLCDMAGITDLSEAYRAEDLSPFWPEGQ